MRSVEEQLKVIRRGVVQICEEGELREKLARGKRLRVKLGVDPTAADLHLGFTVVLRKLRQFQELGHQAVLIIGTYTAQVGDPSGRDKSRPQLAEETVMANAEKYLAQAGKVLDLSRVEVRYNGEWFKGMKFMDVIKLLAKSTVARMLEREDFSGRVSAGVPIYLHEIVYPLMQGYDSVVVGADVELGGSDQTFNLMMGRDLQRDAGQEPQVCITMPLLEGLDGVRKMSKSFGNYVGINEAPKEMFGKIMSVSDEMMWKYYELVTDVALEEIEEMREGVTEGGLHPMEVKKRLAGEIVRMYHGEGAAREAREEFERVFSAREVPSEMREVRVVPDGEGRIDVVGLLVKNGLASSNGEARRLIGQGAVELGGERVKELRVVAPREGEVVLRAGKRRFLRVIIERGGTT
ncbi:MAG: tyrosine--tRNA ligase [bacterium]|nr:tyrosine--tRNA ligase [bacterium]